MPKRWKYCRSFISPRGTALYYFRSVFQFPHPGLLIGTDKLFWRKRHLLKPRLQLKRLSNQLTELRLAIMILVVIVSVWCDIKYWFTIINRNRVKYPRRPNQTFEWSKHEENWVQRNMVNPQKKTILSFLWIFFSKIYYKLWIWQKALLKLRIFLL